MKQTNLLTKLLLLCLCVVGSVSSAWSALTTKSDFTNGEIFLLTKSNVDDASWIEKGSGLTSTGEITPKVVPVAGASSNDITDGSTKAIYYKEKRISDNRQITLKISGLSKMKIYAFSGSSGRNLCAKVDDGTEQSTSVNQSSYGDSKYYGQLELTLTSGEHTIVVYGSNELQVTALKVWTAAATTYTVTYDGNGNDDGDVPTDSNSPYASGSKVTVLGNTGSLAKTGYVFNGWNTKADGSGTGYAAAGTFTISGNTTLYAQWTAATYTVTLTANSAQATSHGSATATYDSNTLTSITAPIWADHAVTGYYSTNDSFGVLVADASGNLQEDVDGFTGEGGVWIATGDRTLYARWLPTYTVTYDGNGKTSGDVPTDSNSPYISGSNVTVLGNTGSLVKTGYVFNGWNTAANGSGEDFVAGDEFEITANTTLYAQWNAVAAPSITTQPVNAVVYIDDVATFTVEATGTPAPSYQWYECDDAEKTNAEAIDGATSASYSPSTAATSTTYYYVVVSNGIGDDAVSNVVSLTVNAAPTISWAFSNNSTSTAPVISASSEKVKSTTVTLGSNVAFENSTDHCYVDSEGEDDVNVSRLKASDTSNNTVTFEVKVRDGVTFTPKSVSFVAMKQGTNGAVTLDAKWMTEDESDITLGTGLALKRASSSGSYATPGGDRFSYNLTSKSAPEVTGKTFGLKLILNTKDKSYGIGEIIISGVISGTPIVTTHDITLSVADGQSSRGTVTPEGDEGVTQVEEGDDLEITANPVAAYKFEKWVIDNDDENPVTTNPYTFENVTADHTAVAYFLARKTISYTVTESQKGTRTDVFGTEYADVDDNFTAPANKYLSTANKTLTGWSDGSKTTPLVELSTALAAIRR